jgi:hypothetical protein
MADGSSIHAMFQDKMKQLGNVSEAFHREGISFVRSLLNANPAQGPKAEEALRHPFLTSHFVGDALDLMPPKVRVLVPQTTRGRELWGALISMLDKEE